MLIYILIYIFSVFVASVSQTLLKKDADKKYDNIFQEYLNPRVIISYGMFFLSSLITVWAYKGVPLSLGPVIESSGYVFVSFLGFIFLKERMSKRKILGIALIVLGVVITNFY